MPEPTDEPLVEIPGPLPVPPDEWEECAPDLDGVTVTVDETSL